MEKIKGWKAIYLLLKNVACFIVYFLSFLFPRNKKIWIYGNFGGNFRDNSKYFYLYCNEHLPEVEHVWISKSKSVISQLKSLGLKASYKYSLSAVYYALAAKVYIYNVYATTDVFNSCFKGNAFLMNLWHGVPYKKIEYDVTTGPLRAYQNPKDISEKIQSFLIEPKVFRKSSAVLVPSEKLISIYSSAFQLPAEKLVVGPYPRNTVFNNKKDELLQFIDKHESVYMRELVRKFDRFNKVIIYMPTWRDANKHFMTDAIPDFDALHEVCKSTNILFLIKSHIYTEFTVDLSKYTHIQNLDSAVDMYPLLPFSDALISDYSSIIFDYSLLKKKVIFYAYDKEEYLSKHREAYFKYEEVFSDSITRDFSGLLQEVENLGKADKNQKYSYPLSEALLTNGSDMSGIVKFIQSSIT